MTNETYTIGAAHQAFGVEGQAYITADLKSAINAAREIAALAGHGWQPYVLDVDGNLIDMNDFVGGVR